MKVLLVNPEFPPSFWSFKETNALLGRKTLMQPLGLITVAALLPREWEFRLVDLNCRQLSTDDWDWADLVMLSGMIIQRQGLLALIREAKHRGKPVAVGGPYATSVSQEVLEAGVDFLVRGEGENTIPLFLEALRQGKEQGVFQAEARPSMANSPLPRYDLVNLQDYVSLSVQTSRGCPFECEFCDVINLYGRQPRYKSPAQVLAELETLYRLGWRDGIFISDDNFIGNQKHAREILVALIPWMKSHGEPFSFVAQTSMNLGQDLETLNLMTEANFCQVFLGVESPDPEVLSLSRKYQNLKNPLEQSLANITANGLSPIASFVIGFDGEEKGAGERICTFVENNNVPTVMLNVLQVVPNTALWDRLQSEGRLLENHTSGNSTIWERLNFIPTRPESEIMAEYREAVNRLYEPSGYLRRACNHILDMRPTRRALTRRQGDLEKSKQTSQNHGPWDHNRREIGALLKLIWRQGILGGCRLQFWRQFLTLSRRNPSRLIRYFHICGIGENLFRLRREILKKPS